MIEKHEIRAMVDDFNQWLYSTESVLKDELKEYSQYHLDSQTNKAREQLGIHFTISEKFRAIFEDVILEKCS